MSSGDSTTDRPTAPGATLGYEDFIRTVQHAADLSWEEAEAATRATLETLGERISPGEARDLADRLPEQVSGWVHTDTNAEGFGVDEFVRRVAEREGIDALSAERHVRAVFLALWRATGARELADVASELSRDYAPLLPVGPQVDVVSSEAFFARVEQRSGLDRDGAVKAVEAVLATLAERLAAGEVDDLIVRLPLELHEPLRRGTAEGGEKAKRMSVEDFVWRVAEREEVSYEQAQDHARAVLATLREALPDAEFRDIDAQLPAEYDPLFA
jgi:uncharacterized protein (DUF2267 family)